MEHVRFSPPTCCRRHQQGRPAALPVPSFEHIPNAATRNPFPPGGISKADLRRFLQWGAAHLGYPALAEVEAAREWAWEG